MKNGATKKSPAKPAATAAGTEPQGALGEALAQWRRTRHPRWADHVSRLAREALAEEAPRPIVGAGRTKADDAAWDELEARRDPLDLGRLFAALRATSAATASARLTRLAQREDPRLVEELLALLADPPWRANLFKPFVTAATDQIVSWGDVRALPVLEELGPRYKGVIETSVGDWVSAKLAATCRKLRGVTVAPLSPADAARLDAAGPAGPSALAPRPVAGGRSEADLLELVYAAPDEDEPRLVYADALSARGDVRGEFIVLQVERARGNGDAARLAREIALHDDAKRRASWALPLSNGGSCRFARGFPARVALNPATARKIVGVPAWATVHEAADLERLSAKLGLELLDHAAAAPLRSIGRLPAWGARLAPRERAFEHVVAQYLPSAAQLATWPRLRRLELEVAVESPTLPAGLLAGAPALRELAFDSSATVDAEALASAPQLTRLTLRLSPLTPDALAPLGALRALALSIERVGEAPRLPRQLEWLELYGRGRTEPRVRALLDALPRLERLTLHDPPDWATCEAVLGLAAERPGLAIEVEELYTRYVVRGRSVEISGVDDMVRSTLARALAAKKIDTVTLAARDRTDPLYAAGPDAGDLAEAQAFFGPLGVSVEMAAD